MANGFDDFAEGFASTFAPTFSKAYQSAVDRHDDLIKNNMTSWNSKYEKYLEAEKTNASSLKQAKSLAAQFGQPESAIPDIAYQIQILGADKVYDDFKKGFAFQPVKQESNDVDNVKAPVADDANATNIEAPTLDNTQTNKTDVVDSRPDNTSTDNQMADGALGDDSKTGKDTGDTDEQTEETFFGRLRREAGEKYTDRVRNETMANLGVSEDVYDKVLAGYTSDITPSGKFTLTSPIKAADYKTVYTATDGVQTFNTSTAKGRTRYQKAVDGGGTPISKPSLSALESMNEGQKYVKPDYVTFYDAKTNIYQQVNVATEDGGTKAAGLVEKGYRQVKDPSVQELETAGFNIDISSLKTYGAAFAASQHLKALETSGVQVPDEVVSGVNNVLTELKPEDTTKKPEWVAVRIGDGPTRYYDENNPNDVKTLREAQDKARDDKETIRFFNISTEPKDDEFKAPEWTGTKSSYHSILHRANTNSEVEGPVGDWARKWLKNEKDSIERMVDNPESITESFIKSEYTRLFQAAQGKGPDSEEAKAFNAFKQSTLPGYLEIHSQFNDATFTVSELAAEERKYRLMLNSSDEDERKTAQDWITSTLPVMRSIIQGAESLKSDATKLSVLYTDQGGQQRMGTGTANSDGGYTLAGGKKVEQDNIVNVFTPEDAKARDAAITKAQSTINAALEFQGDASSAVSAAYELDRLAAEYPNVLTAAGGVQAFGVSLKNEFEAIIQMIGSGGLNGQSAQDVRDKVFQRIDGRVAEGLSDTDAAAFKQFSAAVIRFTFKQGKALGQAGNGFSNADYNNINRSIVNSNDYKSFSNNIRSLSAQNIQAIDTRVGQASRSVEVQRLYEYNAGNYAEGSLIDSSAFFEENGISNQYEWANSKAGNVSEIVNSFTAEDAAEFELTEEQAAPFIGKKVIIYDDGMELF